MEKIFLKLRLGEKVNRVKLISFRPECQGFGEAAVESVNQLIETAPEESTTKLREGHQTWDEEEVLSSPCLIVNLSDAFKFRANLR